MAFPQYNHQWTPLYQYNNGYNVISDYNTAPVHWTNNAQPVPHQPVAYKPAAAIETLEIDDSSALNDGKSKVPPYRRQTFRQKYFGGLKRTLRLFTLLAVIILILNVSWLGHAYSNYGVTLASDGFRYGTISSGSCDVAKRTNTWLHFAINVMSTLLLTGSNAFMAAYSGPTRLEVDKAHAKRRWLHIGSMSLRNMRGIAKRKSFVVLLLAISSAPFHLLYNSLVFTSLSTNDYYWMVVTENFLTGAKYNLTGRPWYHNNTQTGQMDMRFTWNGLLPNDTSANWGNVDTQHAVKIMYDYFDDVQKSAPTWEKLDQKACIQTYANAFVSDRRNVVLVSSDKNDTNSVLKYNDAIMDGGDITKNWWICSMGGNDGGDKFCNPAKYVENATSWKVYDHPIQYCLSQKVKDVCEVKFSLDIMYILLGFNALKVIAMVWILFRINAEHILTSVGDAAISFLGSPDPTTLGMCLANQRNIASYWRTPNIARFYEAGAYRRWGQAVSRKRWVMFFIMIAFSLLAIAFFAWWGFTAVKAKGVDLTFASLWSLGIGTVNQFTMAIYEGVSNVIFAALLANIPQVILAIVWLVFQGIITAMFTSADWAGFAFKSQTLMVSTPAGKQRGTWLLGAPMVYGVGFVTLQTLLHWFISQSVFLVQLTIYDKTGTIAADKPVYSNCGYSPIAIVFSSVASISLCLSAILLRMRRLPVGAPPITSTCSAAISAACHMPVHIWNGLKGQGIDEMVHAELRWGVTDRAPNGVGHCSLGPADFWATGRGSHPVNGWGYAGLVVGQERENSVTWKDGKEKRV